MMHFKFLKIYSVTALSLVIAIGCSKAILQKSDELLAAEDFYQQTLTNPQVNQYAEPEIKKAGEMLDAAAKAHSTDEMAHLVYIINNLIKTAITVAEMKSAEARTLEINKLLRTNP